MMRIAVVRWSCLAFLLLASAWGNSPGTTAFAEAPKPKPCSPCTVGGSGSNLVVTGASAAQVPGRGRPKPSDEAGLAAYSYVDEYVTPFCLGNGLNGAELLCSNAVDTCPAPAEIRYWIWHRTISVVVGPPRQVTEGAWEQLPGSYCLGPTDPGVPSIAAVIAAVRDSFARQVFPIPVSAVKAQPGPTTLVNLDTWFSAASAPVTTIDTVILGTAVHITPVAQSYAWSFGDGATQTGPEAGEQGTDEVAHTYRQTGSRTVSVSVTYSGTFRVGDSPQEYALRTPAVVPGTPTTLQVRQARAELVSR